MKKISVKIYDTNEEMKFYEMNEAMKRGILVTSREIDTNLDNTT